MTNPALEEFIKDTLGLPSARLASGGYQSFGAAMAAKTHEHFVVPLQAEVAQAKTDWDVLASDFRAMKAERDRLKARCAELEAAPALGGEPGASLSARNKMFEQWHNQFYGEQGCNSGIRSLARGYIGYLDNVTQAQACAFGGALDHVAPLRAEIDRLGREQSNDAIAYKAAIEQQDELRAERDTAYAAIKQTTGTVMDLVVERETLIAHNENLKAERDTLKVECEGLREEAERYRWLRDKSESVHQFYLSTPIWFTGVKFSKENVDRTIDAARAEDASTKETNNEQ